MRSNRLKNVVLNMYVSCKKYNLGEIVKHFLEQMELKNNTLIFL